MVQNNPKQFVKKYMHEMRKLLITSTLSDYKYLKHFNCQLIEYIEESSVDSYESLVKQIGTPQSTVASYYKSKSGNVLLKQLRFRKFLIRLFLFIIFILFCYTLGEYILLKKATNDFPYKETKHFIIPPAHNDILK